MIWLWVPLEIISVLLVLVVVVTGTTVFRAPEWAAAFHELARQEARRRGFTIRQISLNDGLAIQRMAGETPETPEDSELELKMIGVLSGSTDDYALTADLAERRQKLLDRMLHRQLRRVEQISTIQWASRVWVAQRFVSRAEIALRGIAWLALRCFKLMLKLTATPAAGAAIISVFIGLPYWQATRNGAPTDPSQLLGTLGSIGLAIAVVVWPAGVLIYRLLVACFGPARHWQKRSVVLACTLVPLAIGLSTGAQYIGEKLQTQHFSERVDSSDPTTMRITMAAMALGFLWIIHRPWRSFRDKQLLTSNRIGALGVIAVLVSFSIFLLGVAVWGYMPQPVRVSGMTIFGIALCIQLLSAVFSTIEWVGRWRWVINAGASIPKRGCLWWLGTTVVSWVGLGLLSSIPALAHVPWVVLPLVVMALIAFVAVWPAAIMTWLFVRRVNTEFERRQISENRDDNDDRGHDQAA
ncbi:hypothetical protein [Mycobacteroides abscessus]|uniref:hypothetical protein n=1 Tax=Mycobacteroides abscessus TaxID=36809 RepID=UPI000C25A4F9|nr:hypothetical protein [Mycobacteroides abscessus]